MTIWLLINIAIGAVLGALSRYYLTLLWLRWRGSAFPYGTLFVNLTGAFIIGVASFLITRYDLYDLSVRVSNVVMVGFLGSYTTFSSYILDTANLLRRRRYAIALGYWFGSVLLGLICAEGGLLAGQWLALRLL
ncbi:MAG: fluoride efflux transporter CrcB [Leptolyngbyaceae cyanobacterium]